MFYVLPRLLTLRLLLAGCQVLHLGKEKFGMALFI
jgi:hypothetical protein